FQCKWLMRLFVVSVAAPYIANQLGWVASKVGRQPWIVHGLLRTSEALSKAVQAEQIMASLVMFTIIYALLFLVFIYSLDRKIKHGPEMHPEDGTHSHRHFHGGFRETTCDRLDCSRHPEPGADLDHDDGAGKSGEERAEGHDGSKAQPPRTTDSATRRDS
ncbi:MAG TPA: cytochrome ubiquinol oxidase subunit I, partial [Candidatus Obscuribacterales bacterium]